MKRTTLLLTLMIAGVAFTAHAQPAPFNPSPLEAAVPSPAAVLTLPIGAVSSVNFATMNAAWWKDLGKQHAQALASPEAATRELAMQQIIYFATYYPEQARLSGGARQALLETYLLDQNEAHRIMALSALAALDDDAAMRHLAQRVRLEGSARVRKLTQAVLAEYFAKN